MHLRAWLIGSLFLVTSLARGNASDDVRAFAAERLAKPDVPLAMALDGVVEWCRNLCGKPEIVVSPIESHFGKQGYSVQVFLVSVAYGKSVGGLGYARTLPLLVTRRAHLGTPAFELTRVLPFGALKTLLPNG